MAGKKHVFLIATLLSLLVSSVVAHGGKQVGVTYDERSLIVNGKRELLFSGSIHYPRSTPDVMIMFFTTKLILRSFFFISKRIRLIVVLNLASDVARVDPEGEGWRFECDPNLCLLEHSRAGARQGKRPAL